MVLARRVGGLRTGALAVVVGLGLGGCHCQLSPERGAHTTFVNRSGVELTVAAKDPTYPAFHTVVADGESADALSLYVRDRYPLYIVSGKIGRATQTLRVRRVQDRVIQYRRDSEELEADRAVVTLSVERGELVARAERGIEVRSRLTP